MNVENLVSDELQAVATAVQAPPPPPVVELVRRAERVRTSTRLRAVAITGLTAAAVIGAIVVGTQVGGPGGSPTPAPRPTELPTGDPVGVPYVLDSKLYVGGRVQPGSWAGVETAGPTSVATQSTDNPDINTVVVFRDGAEVTRFPIRQNLRTLLSPDGTKLAWVEIDATSAHLVVRDTGNNRILGRLPVSRALLGHIGPETEGWESLYRVTNDGTVSYGGVVVAHTWKPGDAPVDHHPQVNPDLLPGFPQDAGWIVVSPDGTWGAWTSDRNGNQYSGEGTPWYADGITVQRPGEPASRRTIALPAGTNGLTLVWDSATTLLVTIADDPDGKTWHDLRCSIVDATCEHAPVPTD